MERIWLDHYPEGVPHEVDPDAHTSLTEIIEASFSKFPDKIAFSNFGTHLTYRELDELSANFAAYLQNELGIGKGDAVALMMPNLLQFPVALLGILRAGGVVVNVNHGYQAEALKHQLNDSGVKVIVVIANSTLALAGVLPETGVERVIVTRVDDLLSIQLPSPEADARLMNPLYFNEVLETGKELNLSPVQVENSDLAVLQYTGGTTGLSKGAELTHRNLISNLLQFCAILDPVLEEGNEVVITALPLYHIFSLTVNCLCFLQKGGTNVLITNPLMLKSFVEELSRWPFSFMTGVNTLYGGLLRTKGFADLDFSHLKAVIGGGAAITAPVDAGMHQLTGKHIMEGYGLSETSPIVSVLPIDISRFYGSIGLPMPSTDISLRDDDGNEVPMGESGEICIRGPQVMRGYWNQPEATREAFTEDGFFKTGDIATIDEKGYLRIRDRKKDMILVSGNNVFPNEVESVADAFEGVMESACVGVPDERTGEAVKLFAVRAEGAEITEADVRRHCTQHLASYKVPRHVEFIEALPKTGVGKILRRELRGK